MTTYIDKVRSSRSSHLEANPFFLDVIAPRFCTDQQDRHYVLVPPKAELAQHTGYHHGASIAGAAVIGAIDASAERLGSAMDVTKVTVTYRAGACGKQPLVALAIPTLFQGRQSEVAVNVATRDSANKESVVASAQVSLIGRKTQTTHDGFPTCVDASQTGIRLDAASLPPNMKGMEHHGAICEDMIERLKPNNFANDVIGFRIALADARNVVAVVQPRLNLLDELGNLSCVPIFAALDVSLCLVGIADVGSPIVTRELTTHFTPRAVAPSNQPLVVCAKFWKDVGGNRAYSVGDAYSVAANGHWTHVAYGQAVIAQLQQ